MKAGDVFYWETDKATGHDRRHKYHLYICEPDWPDEHTFLFISSNDNGGDYRITKPPYDFLKKPESFVSCSSIVCYSEAELTKVGKPVGQLTPEHLMELHAAVTGSDFMEGRHMKKICNAIMDLFK
jgi:hypothetical protein